MKAAGIDRGPLGNRPGNAGAASIPLFHAAWQFAVGIVVARYIWLRPSYLLIALAPVAILCAISAFRAQRIAWLPLATLWCLLGTWCAAMQPQPAPEPALAAQSDGLMRSIEGTVVHAGPVRSEAAENSAENPDPETFQRLDLRLANVEVVTDAEDAQKPTAGSVRLTVRWPAGQEQPAGFHCGDRVRADARLILPTFTTIPERGIAETTCSIRASLRPQASLRIMLNCSAHRATEPSAAVSQRGSI